MSHGVIERLFSSRESVSPELPPPAYDPSESVADRSYQYALDALPCNAMFCDRDLIIRHINRSSRKALLDLQRHLPVRVDALVGQPIRILDPSLPAAGAIMSGEDAHGSGASSEPPYEATVKLGSAQLDFRIKPMIAEDGSCAGAAIVWSFSTQRAKDALRHAQDTQRNDLEHLTGNLQVVATASREVEVSIAEIAKNAENVARAAEASRTSGDASKAAIESLRVSSNGVGKVAELISSIATQTSVLALNANIEAARAGAHGRGFAVVASEVRKLAEQTASATEEIQNKVSAIGENVHRAISAIDHISGQLDEVSGLSRDMAGATEKQYTAAREMAHNVERAAFRAGEISKTCSQELATA